MLFADRTSPAWMRSKQLRRYFSLIAHRLLDAPRRLGLKGMAWAQATTIRLKVLKVEAPIRVTVGKVRIALAGGHPYAAVWASVWAHLQPVPVRV